MKTTNNGYTHYWVCICGTYFWRPPDVCVTCGRENPTKQVVARYVTEHVSFLEWLQGRRSRSYYEQAHPPLLTDRQKFEKCFDIIDGVCEEVHRSPSNRDCGVDGMCDACKIKTALYQRMAALGKSV